MQSSPLFHSSLLLQSLAVLASADIIRADPVECILMLFDKLYYDYTQN